MVVPALDFDCSYIQHRLLFQDLHSLVSVFFPASRGSGVPPWSGAWSNFHLKDIFHLSSDGNDMLVLRITTSFQRRSQATWRIG